MSDLLMRMPVNYEPKFKNRWVINFKGYFKDIPKWVPSKTSRPKWVVDNEKVKDNINNGNSWDNITSGSWADIEIFLRDPIFVSTSKVLMEGFRLSGEGDKKIKYNLELLDPSGVTVEKWKIKGVLQEVDFGELDYSIDSLAEIKLTIRPTKVVLVY